MADAVLDAKGAADILKGRDVGDIHMDSIQCERTDRIQRDEDSLLAQLVEIDEEMGSDDTELLKFVCRDKIGVSKLERVSSALDIFLQLKKLALIKASDVDFLVECLGLIHRFDLIRKLGYDDIDGVKEQFPYLKRINLFTKLLLEIGEDLDDSELSKMKFLLGSSVPKKTQQDLKTVLDLFNFMERENLLSHIKTDILLSMLKNIKRTDLVLKIQQFTGGPPLPSTINPGLQNGRENLYQRHPVQVPPRIVPEYILPTEPQIENVTVLSASASREPNMPNVNRSASAGTLTLSNSEGEEEPNNMYVEMPPALLNEITQVIAGQDKWNDFGFEIALSLEQMKMYEERHADVPVRVRMVLDDWCEAFRNKKEIAPKLMYILEKIDCKSVKEKILQWQYASARNMELQRRSEQMGTNDPGQGQGSQMAVAQGQGHGDRMLVTSQRHPSGPVRGHDVNFTVNTGNPPSPFMPKGPPQLSENQCSSMREAQVHVSEGNDIRIQQIAGQMNAMTIGQAMHNQLSTYPYPTPPLPQQTFNPPLRYHLSEPLPGQMPPSPEWAQTPNGQVPVAPVTDGNRSLLPEYPMSKRPRGWCVIINNRDFHVIINDSESKQMPQRLGTDVDAESLQHVFNRMGFIIRRKDNLTNTQMMQFLIDVAHNVDHTNFECFACCILTHGVINHLFGTNGKLISIKDLTSMFQSNRCPSLAGKPKLFFLQACQGREKMTGGEVKDVERDASGDLQTDSDQEMIPNESDFLIGYATVPGYVSFRSRTHGSWYIRKLCEMLEKLGHKEDLLSILVQVNNEVSQANATLTDGIYKQTPAPLVTLRKKLFFR